MRICVQPLYPRAAVHETNTHKSLVCTAAFSRPPSLASADQRPAKLHFIMVVPYVAKGECTFSGRASFCVEMRCNQSPRIKDFAGIDDDRFPQAQPRALLMYGGEIALVHSSALQNDATVPGGYLTPAGAFAIMAHTNHIPRLTMQILYLGVS